MVALTVGALAFASPSVSQAATITNVTVTLGGVTWCAFSCTNNIWGAGFTAAGGSITITGAQSLILTQTAGFNFDTSDVALGNALITITQTVGGTATFTDNANVLGNFGLPDTTTNAEAAEWTLPLVNVSSGLKLWVGYADTAHADAFVDPGLNGLPDGPWLGTQAAGSTFIGAAGGSSGAGGCVHGTPVISPCFDAGALRIEVAPTPEPSILLLMGIGLVGIAAFNRKKAKNNV